MSDRINELAAQKRHEAQTLALAEAAEGTAKWKVDLKRQTEAEAVRKEIFDLATRFYAWTKRHNLSPMYARINPIPYPIGWIIGYHSVSDGEGYSSHTSHYALLVTPTGLLEMLERTTFRIMYKKTWRISLGLFDVSDVDEAITAIVLRTGLPWD
jgi:hypothetical protein